MFIKEKLELLKTNIPNHVTLVAVSKTKPIADIQEAYEAGQKIFGENKVQEMVQKSEELPKDIQWHMIGHVQTNKVKYIAPFVKLIHAVDSMKLLKEINGVDSVGPIMLGMRKPVHILQLGASVEEIVNMAAVAVVDAQQKEKREETAQR